MWRLMAKLIVAALVASLTLIVGRYIGPSPTGANHDSHGSIRFTHPAAFDATHPPGDITQAWHSTGPYALDWETYPGTGYYEVFRAHVHIVAWHPGYGWVAKVRLDYKPPGESQSGCHEVVGEIYNVVTNDWEGTYALYHVGQDYDVNTWWDIFGSTNGTLQGYYVGSTTTSDSCDWDGTHIHETHRNKSSTFYKNTTRYDSPSDPLAAWDNWWDDHTRGLEWW